MLIAAGSDFSGGKVWEVKSEDGDEAGAETQTAARIGGGSCRRYVYYNWATSPSREGMRVSQFHLLATPRSGLKAPRPSQETPPPSLYSSEGSQQGLLRLFPDAEECTLRSSISGSHLKIETVRPTLREVSDDWCQFLASTIPIAQVACRLKHLLNLL